MELEDRTLRRSGENRDGCHACYRRISKILDWSFPPSPTDPVAVNLPNVLIILKPYCVRYCALMIFPQCPNPLALSLIIPQLYKQKRRDAGDVRDTSLFSHCFVTSLTPGPEPVSDPSPETLLAPCIGRRTLIFDGALSMWRYTRAATPHRRLMLFLSCS